MTEIYDSYCSLIHDHGFTLIPCNLDGKRKKAPTIQEWQKGFGWSHDRWNDEFDEGMTMGDFFKEHHADYYWGFCPHFAGLALIDVDTLPPLSKNEFRAQTEADCQEQLLEHFKEMCEAVPELADGLVHVNFSGSGKGLHIWGLRSGETGLGRPHEGPGEIYDGSGQTIIYDAIGLLKALNAKAATRPWTTAVIRGVLGFWGADEEQDHKGTFDNLPPLDEAWPEGIRDNACHRWFLKAYIDREVTHLEPQIAAAAKKAGLTTREIEKCKRSAKSWVEKNHREVEKMRGDGLTRVEKYMICTSRFIKDNPHIAKVYPARESKEPSHYMTFNQNEGWVEKRHADAAAEMGRTLIAHVDGGDGFKSIQGDAMSVLAAQVSRTTYEVEWDADIRSLPFLDGGHSLSLAPETVGDVIATPMEHMMSRPLGCDSLSYQNADINRWEEMVEMWLPQQDARAHIQELFGQALIGNPATKVPILEGQGANGKSVFIDALCLALGGDSYAGTVGTKWFLTGPKGVSDDHLDALFRLYRWRMVFVGEVDSSGQTFRLDNIKRLTGGDQFQASRKNQPNVVFRPLSMPVIYGNHLPYLRDHSNSTKRRFCILNFPVNLEEKHPEAIMLKNRMNDKLKELRPAILAWLVIGLARFYANGERLTPSPTIEADTKQWLEDENEFAQHIDEILIKARTENAFVSYRSVCTVLEKKYRSSYPNGMRGKRLGALLRENGYGKFICRRTRGYGLEGFALAHHVLSYVEGMAVD